MARHEAGCTPDGEPVRLLHPTSMASEHHLWQPLNLSIQGCRAVVDFKTFRRADLRDEHIQALQTFVTQHAERLIKSTLLSDS
jgi:hypothetical protein